MSLQDTREYKAYLFDLAVRKGLITLHSERLNPHDPATRVSWMEGHDKSCDISNVAHDAAKQQEA